MEKFLEDCFPWEKPHDGTGEECEEEGAAEMTYDELTTTPIPCPPAPLGEEAENLGVKWSPGSRNGWGEGVLRFGFISHYPI